MIEVFAILLVLGLLWLAVSVVGLVLKLVLGLVAGLFSVFGGLLALFLGLLVLPVVALVALPFLLPLALMIGLVWLLARAVRRPVATAAPNPR
jgi:hypothetical protein